MYPLLEKDQARALLDGPLPEHGIGSVDAVTDLLRVGTATATHSSGPRFFHFVMGGATPAAMAGDWLTSLLDQNARLWTASPLATTAETVALRWLKEMFGLPAMPAGRLDLKKLEREVASLTQPAVILASAGEVNAGDGHRARVGNPGSGHRFHSERLGDASRFSPTASSTPAPRPTGA